jgi:uncharacterized membrane protein YkoI
MRILMCAVTVAGILAHSVTGVWAGDRDDDHERARRALEAGEIVPLDRILQQVQAHYQGTVVELELTQEDGRWVYEVELAASDGRLLQLRIDAKSTQLLHEDED